MSQPFKMREKVYLPDLNKEFPPTNPEDPDEDFPDHTWIFWSSPRESIYNALVVMLFPRKDGEYTDEEEDAYVSAITELVLDTGESEIDLDTPEKVRATFLPDGNGALVGAIILTYTALLYKRRGERQKKILARSNSTGTGTSRPQTASASPT